MGLKKYTYAGRGKLLMGLYGGAIRDIGIFEELKLSLEEETQELENFEDIAGGVAESVSWVKKVKVSFSIHELTRDNLALASLGTASVVAAGTVTDEAHKAWKGSYVPLKYIKPTITSVKVGNAEKDAGADYVANASGLYIPPASSIADDADIAVSYSYPAQEAVEAMTATNQVYTMIFQGANLAQDGRSRIIHMYKVKLSPASELALVTKELAKVAMTGVLLADDSQPTGKSRYYKEILEAAA
ncbi:MAG: hypothetical protein HQL73_06565 [Magnetococcales bacterium]|nr:hypothetical protein [Magnetococcales bacterium]